MKLKMNSKKNFQNSGKFAVVTGASSGLGYVFAKRLAAQGLNIVAVARRKSLLEKLAAELETQNVLVEQLALDLTNRQDLEKLEKIFERENIVYLVNNAGVGKAGSFANSSAADAQGQIDLNITALVRLSHAAAYEFVRRGEGSILNVSSLAAFVPVPGFAVYAATKAFVKSFTNALAHELKKTGVRVASVCPGYTKTEFIERAGLSQSIEASAMSSDEVVEAALVRFEQGETEIVIGLANRSLATLGTVLPPGIATAISDLVFKRQMSQR